MINSKVGANRELIKINNQLIEVKNGLDPFTPHPKGTPCMDLRCPKCGAKMLRKDSFHHQKVQEKKNK